MTNNLNRKSKLEYLKLHIWQLLRPKSQNCIQNFLKIAIPRWEQAIQEVDTPHFSYWRATTSQYVCTVDYPPFNVKDRIDVLLENRGWILPTTSARVKPTLDAPCKR